MAERKKNKEKIEKNGTVSLWMNSFMHHIWLIVDPYNPFCILISLSVDGALIDFCAGIHFEFLLTLYLPYCSPEIVSDSFDLGISARDTNINQINL